MFRSLALAAASIAAQAPLFAQATQTSNTVVTAIRPGQFQTLPKPPVPADPLELVTGPADIAQTTEQRAAAAAMLTKARALSNVRAQPYDLKTSFTSVGTLPSDGTWSLEDISPGAGIYRWSAQGPGYSAVNLYTDTTAGVVYSNQPAQAIPLRLAQVRGALFFNAAPLGPRASMRTAIGYLDGKTQNCVLIVPAVPGQSPMGSRNWEEEEYCIDRDTGLLTVYSPAPGLYVHYTYPSAANFHGKFVATGFEIEQAGRSLIRARTDSIADPPSAQDPRFSTSGLTAAGVGREMMAPGRVRLSPMPNGCGFPLTSAGPPRPCTGNPVIQVVNVHGLASPDGRIIETEIVATSDPTLNQAALDRLSRQPFPGMQSQPGTTPLSHEIFATVEFVQYAP